MVFSSKIFLFFFLPIVLLGYYLIKRNRKLSNVFLTVMSLGFYAWGEPRFVLVMMLSIVVNWLFGLWVDHVREDRRSAKLVITLMAVFNIGLLGVFKYLGFFMSTVKSVLGLTFTVPQIALPIGISFFTFQAMSYVIDVYRGNGRVQKNLINVCLYISFFPQLIAGPIVRYQTVADEIDNRTENFTDFTEGARRFMVGFCKKMILANNLGNLVDTAFRLNSADLSVATAWIAACAYLMQVYYDFSGYSDMAIGLGRMFGFHFSENFMFPFIAKSVGEFWRRWHISLSTWFRDYVYIPLGGSRVSTGRWIFNMLAVWGLTGLWHGAAWAFVLWGLGFWIVQVVEKLWKIGPWMEAHPWIGHLYAMVFVVAITVLIRAEQLDVAGRFYSSMFAVGGTALFDSVTRVLLREYGVFLIAAVICGLPVGKLLREKIHVPENAMEIAGACCLLGLMVIAISYVVVVDYNPFIYFNF